MKNHKIILISVVFVLVSASIALFVSNGTMDYSLFVDSEPVEKENIGEQNIFEDISPDSVEKSESASEENLVDTIKKDPSNRDEASKLRLSPEKEKIRSLSQSFVEAESAIDAARIIDSAEFSGIENATDWRFLIDTICSTYEINYHIENTSDESQNYLEQYLDFCNNYVPTMDVSNLDLLAPDSIFSRLYQKMKVSDISSDFGSLSTNEAQKRIDEFILNSTTPEELSALAEYLDIYYQETGQILWQPDVSRTPINKSSISSLQLEALELISCYRFGGCGSSSIKVIRTCLWIGICQSHWTYEDIVFNTHSPVEYEYITSVISQIGRKSPH